MHSLLCLEVTIMAIIITMMVMRKILSLPVTRPVKKEKIAPQGIGALEKGKVVKVMLEEKHDRSSSTIKMVDEDKTHPAKYMRDEFNLTRRTSMARRVKLKNIRSAQKRRAERIEQGNNVARVPHCYP